MVLVGTLTMTMPVTASESENYKQTTSQKNQINAMLEEAEEAGTFNITMKRYSSDKELGYNHIEGTLETERYIVKIYKNGNDTEYGTLYWKKGNSFICNLTDEDLSYFGVEI